MTPYEAIGGEAALRALVDRFYAHMDALPEAARIRAMHPASLDRARERLFEFLSGWSGGPNLYWERHGHPRLRARHLPFPIDREAAAAWMLCMTRAADELIPDPEFRAVLLRAFAGVADHMRNQDVG